MLQNFLKICFTFAFFSLASAETYTFTNAGATGQNGPTQTQITSSYSGSNLAGNVTINTQGIQEWTVPFSGEYEIEAKGASGGSSSSNSRLGGKGASIKGTFSLTQNSTLKILVGQQGMEGTHSNKDYGGGGGSFVIQSPYNNNGSILIEDNPKILAAIIAMCVGIYSKNIIATIFAGLASYWTIIFI